MLLDADSVVSVDALTHMIAASEHQANSDVAVFQAKVKSNDHHTSVFAKALGVGTLPRAWVLERVHSRLGMLLSFGHNQLLRVSALQEVGGFDEHLAAEDTALSFSLASLGWRIGMVNVWTEDREPQSIATFNRRTLRWAAQTVQLFRNDWVDAPVRLKLLLC